MTLLTRTKLAGLGFGAGLMATLIVLITLSAQKQVSDLRIRLNTVAIESSGIMDQFKDSVRELNNDMLRYGTDHDLATWETSCVASSRLDDWIGQQQRGLHTPAEGALLTQLQTAYINYVQAASNFHDRVEFLDGKNVLLADFAPVRRQSQHLFDLGQALARLHYQAYNSLLRHTNDSLEVLHFLVLILLGVLFVIGVTLVAGIYRHLVAPLRLRLGETQAFAEQYEELASLGLLASSVADEIRNSLKSIRIRLSHEKGNFKSRTSSEKATKIAEREIHHLEQILEDFRMFTKPTNLKFTIIQLDDFLQNICRFFAIQLVEANVQLATEVSAPLWVRADATQLTQVMINLVQNAANSIGRNGVITLRARSDRRLLGGKEAEVAILEVADTGKGLPPDVERQLFRPFFTTKIDGMGLGLSIAAHIIQKHGGEMEYQAHINHGTVFGIILPQAERK